MTQSLRLRLAARLAGSTTLALVLISGLSLVGAREFLDSELESNLLNVASIQAASLTGEPGGAMRFHEWDLTPAEASQVRELNRYAQVWSASGESLLRTQYITADLPLDTTALEEAAAGRLVTTEQRFQDMPIRSLYYPLERLGPAHARHVLQVAAPLTGRNRLLRQLAWLLAAITLVVAAASFAGGWWLGGRMVRPLREIMDQAEAMRAGTLGRRISAEADTREYQRLVAVLNGMLARLEAAFESQRRFTADASHELRGPLTALRGELELALRRERDPAEYQRVIASGLQEAQRLSRLAEDLLTLARSDAGVMQPRLQVADLAKHAAAVVERLMPRARDKRVGVQLHAETEARAVVDPGLIDQLLWNLIENAIKFTSEGGHVDVRITEAGPDFLLEVQDTGPGIQAQDLTRVFERFYRADTARTPVGDPSGTGLGLSIVQAVARVHGGQAQALNAPGGGAVLRVNIPAVPGGRTTLVP